MRASLANGQVPPVTLLWIGMRSAEFGFGEWLTTSIPCLAGRAVMEEHKAHIFLVSDKSGRGGVAILAPLPSFVAGVEAVTESRTRKATHARPIID